MDALNELIEAAGVMVTAIEAMTPVEHMGGYRDRLAKAITAVKEGR